jgi:tetratricopeptide (TPR) repeat protein
MESTESGAGAHVAEANAYLALKRTEDAADSLEVALALDPLCLPALCKLALIRRDQGYRGDAIGLLERACALDPARADLLIELAILQNRDGRTAAAMSTYRSAIERFPSDPAARVNLGLIYLQQLGRPREAEALFREALVLDFRQLEALANLGLALTDQGRHDEALELYEQAAAIHPESDEFRWNRGFAKLSLGEYAAGWKDYELRFKRRGGRSLDRFCFPQWNGQRLAEGRLLVLAEQGLGDEIMFSSCLPDLRELSPCGVILECAPRLAGLFARSFPGCSVHGMERDAETGWLEAYPDLVAKIAIGSLPQYLRNENSRFPAHKGYLINDEKRTRVWRERLGALSGHLKVGVSWRAGTRATRGQLRSIEREKLRELFAVSNVSYVSLQPDMSVEDRQWARQRGIHEFEGLTGDFDEVAGLVCALDLVVTVANTNAHLAGALGRPAWVLLNESPEWRWLRVGDRSPWYPSLRLFRCAAESSWEPLVSKVCERMRRLAAEPLTSAEKLLEF